MQRSSPSPRIKYFFREDSTNTEMSSSPIRLSSLPQTFKAVHEGTLYRPREIVNFIWTSLYCVFGEGYLFIFDSPKKKTIEQCFKLELTVLNELPQIESRSYKGFKFQKGGHEQIFYTKTMQEFEAWKSVLKQWCILTSFHEDYTIKEMIGLGSNAKVSFE